jgi:hypothetical protein
VRLFYLGLAAILQNEWVILRLGRAQADAERLRFADLLEMLFWAVGRRLGGYRRWDRRVPLGLRGNPAPGPPSDVNEIQRLAKY